MQPGNEASLILAGYCQHTMCCKHTALTERCMAAGLIPLFIYARQHPTNIILLAAWVRCAAFLLFCSTKQ